MTAETFVFPLLLPIHVIFVIIGVVYLTVRFVKYHKPYQLMMAVAIFLTLFYRILGVIPENVVKILIMSIGIAELVLLVLSIVSAVISQVKYKNSLRD